MPSLTLCVWAVECVHPCASVPGGRHHCIRSQRGPDWSILFFRLLPEKASAAGQSQPASPHHLPSKAAATVGQHEEQAAALARCSMEELPSGCSAFNTAQYACTMEQLPSGRHTPASPPVSPTPPQPKSFGGPGAVPVPRLGKGGAEGRQQEQGGVQAVEQGQKQGTGVGLLGVGLSARNAVAALCSARRQSAQLCNPYRLTPATATPPGSLSGLCMT